MKMKKKLRKILIEEFGDNELNEIEIKNKIKEFNLNYELVEKCIIDNIKKN